MKEYKKEKRRVKKREKDSRNLNTSVIRNEENPPFIGENLSKKYGFMSFLMHIINYDLSLIDYIEKI